MTSAAFADGGRIPVAHTCDGPDVSPPLAWSGVPQAARALQIRVRDVDASYYVHWDVVDVPASVTSIAAGEQPRGTVRANSFGRARYNGPCPPEGSAYHRYVFEVRALDAAGDELAVGTIVGTYARP